MALRLGDVAPNSSAERFAAAGVPKEDISCVKDTYTFNFPSSPSELVAAFRKYHGPTMNAFQATEKNGRAADLQKELETLFISQNRSPNPEATSIPATFLRVTVTLKSDGRRGFTGSLDGVAPL